VGLFLFLFIFLFFVVVGSCWGLLLVVYWFTTGLHLLIWGILPLSDDIAIGKNRSKISKEFYFNTRPIILIPQNKKTSTRE